MPILKPRINRWSHDAKESGLLIFAQALEEKLFDYTLDSYKARALNIHVSIFEIAAVADLVKEEKIKAGSLIPLIEELEYQFNNDLLITKEEKNVFVIYLERLKRYRSRINDFIDVVDALMVEVQGFYWDRIKQKISQEVKKSKNSKLLIYLADVFITECEIQGYHRSHVFNVTKKFFWRKKIETGDAIDQFLSLFDRKRKKYAFYLRVNSCFKEIEEYSEKFGLKLIEGVPEIKGEHAHVNEFLANNKETPYYVKTVDIEATNPVSARVRVEAQLDGLASVYSFFVHQYEPKWQPAALCVTENDNFAGLFKPQLQPVKKCIHGTVDASKEEIETVVELLSGVHFTSADTYVFLKALEYHRAAITDETPENQLVDLWAALEGFLPVPNSEDNRISHYVSVIMPCLTLTYAEKLFRYLTDSIYTKNMQIVEYIDGVIEGVDPFDRVVSLVCCDEYEKERAEVLGMMSCNPLLRYRCFHLHEMFKDSSKVARTLLEHKQRVSWHMQRIYITRNQIVHNASAFPYLHTLVENLHSYIDLMIKAVAQVGVQSQRKSSASGALRLLSVSEQSTIRMLQEQKVACTKENYKTIVFGPSNPLSPFFDRFTLK